MVIHDCDRGAAPTHASNDDTFGPSVTYVSPASRTQQADHRVTRSAALLAVAGASAWENGAAMAFLYRLLPPRPTFAGDMSAAEADLMQRHVDDEQAAREIGERDPAVETGTCTFELVPMELVRPG